MTAIKLIGVGLGLPDRILLQDINVSLGRGRQGLVGFNGVGKSTLARLLTGELEPTSGRIERCVNRVVMLTQKSSHDSRPLEARLREVEETLGWIARSSRTLDWRAWLAKVPARLSFELLSGGEQMRLRLLEVLAQTARLESDGFSTLVVLDEPTNDLDRLGRDLVREWVRARDHGLLLISHDRELLAQMDEILELSSLGLKIYGGGYSAYAVQAEALQVRSEDAVRDSQRELKKKKREAKEKRERQERRMRAGKKRADQGGMPRILLGARKRRAQETCARIDVDEAERVDSADRNVAFALGQKRLDPFLRLDFAGEAKPASQILFRTENLKIKEGPGWTHALTFQIAARDRIWLRGPSGSGKSTLLEILMKAGREVSGELWRSPSLDEHGSIGFLDQRQSSLRDEMTVLETITESTRLSPSEVRNELAFYGFIKESVMTKVSGLSGGERLRLALAKIFLGPRLPSLLVLDEPTNNLDFTSLDLLALAIDRFPGGVILVTHDEVFGRARQGFETLSLE